MNLRAKKSYDILARCGRCADILPEQTLTYCPACGVPFSEVPATQSYNAFADRAIVSALRSEKRRWFLVAFFFFGFFISFQFFLAVLRQKQETKNLKSLIRPLEIYTFDFENIPHLNNAVKRQALGIALQSFEDHFKMNLTEISYRENKLPRDFEPLFQEISQKFPKNSKDTLSDFAVLATKLSFWEQKIYPELTKKWAQNPLAPLTVIVTNLPLFVDDASSSQIETRHLGKEKIISGLGHPAFVLISTYRLHPESDKLRAEAPPVKDDSERARFLGEFVIAHELGHALLGLPDFVEDSDKNGAHIRSPAQIDETLKGSIKDQCLMHTDKGGGFFAWQSLRQRKLGNLSQCNAYEETQRALLMREESVRLLKKGFETEALKLHSSAITILKSSSPPWLTQLVQKEHFLFTSPINYWLSQFVPIP